MTNKKSTGMLDHKSNKNVCSSLTTTTHTHTKNKQKKKNLSCRMGKPTICIGKNKGADQLCSNCTADQCLCFRYTDNTVIILLKSKHFQPLTIFCNYSPVCVRPGQNPICWFSHAQAQLSFRVSDQASHN